MTFRSTSLRALCTPAFLAVSVLSACGDSVVGPGSTAITVDRVEVSPSSSVMTALGQSTQLTATAFSASGTVVGHKTFSWSSSNPAVAEVSSDGSVTARGAGTTTVTATTDRIDGTATVTVEPGPLDQEKGGAGPALRILPQ